MLKKVLDKIDFILLFSAFLPYLMISAGIRFEHLVVYGLLALLFFQGAFLRYNQTSFSPVIVLFLLIMMLVGIFSIGNNLALNGEFLAKFENYTETLALFLIFNYLLVRKNYFSINRIIRINTFFHNLLALNTCLVLIEIFTPFADQFLGYYIGVDDGGYRTATDSMGRYMGVFNLPMESGFAYSLGLLTWLYNFNRKKEKNNIFEAILFIALIIGGFASVSKVFYILGLGLFLFSLFAVGRFRNKFFFLLLTVAVLSYIIPNIAGSWRGLNILDSEFTKITTQFSLTNISAGRMGGNDGIYSWVLDQDFTSLIVGHGFTQGDLLHLDSEYMQILYQGGLFALLLYLLIMIILYVKCAKLNKKIYVEKMILFAVLALGTFTALGGPMIFMNRVRIFFFLQLFFMYKLSRAVFVKSHKIQNRKPETQSYQLG